MKKILLSVMVFLFTGILFAENYLKDYIKEFLNKGNYILVDSDSDAYFYPKHILAKLECDSDDLRFTYVDKEFDYETKTFNTGKYIIKLDEDSNLIILKK